MHTPYGDTTYIRGVIERGNKHLRWALNLGGCRNLLKDGIQKGGDIFGGLLVVLAHPALLSRAVDGLKVQLFFAGIEAKHQVEDHILHLFRAAVRLIDLVDDDDRLEPHLYSLL